MIRLGKIAIVGRSSKRSPLIDPAEITRCFPDASLERLYGPKKSSSQTDASVEPVGVPAQQAALEQAKADLELERKAWEDERQAAREERLRLLSLLELALQRNHRQAGEAGVQ
jgi:multidrug efflux pump subunit AcrA (membrane-fusion protein)